MTIVAVTTIVKTLAAIVDFTPETEQMNKAPALVAIKDEIADALEKFLALSSEKKALVVATSVGAKELVTATTRKKMKIRIAQKRAIVRVAVLDVYFPAYSVQEGTDMLKTA